ncbi:hypothetical protein Tco_0135630 [Tanacetum coccineum]
MAAALEDKMTLTFRNEMNEMKNMMKALVATSTLIKAVEERCTTCGNSGYPPSSVASYTRPPGFTQSNPQASRPNQGYNGTRNVNQTNQVNHGANSGLTQQAQAYQAPSTQVPVTYARFEP